jgi:replicative DNA helicase
MNPGEQKTPNTGQIPRAIEKGMPCNLDAERFVLGSILFDEALYTQAAGMLESEDFSLEKHRRIFRRMGELSKRAEHIDRATVANELLRWNELESCDGLSYLVSLDDDLPHLPNIGSYVRIVKDKSLLRRMIFASQNMMSRCLTGEDDPATILDGMGRYVTKMQSRYEVAIPLRTPLEVMQSHPGGVTGFLSEGIKMGLPTGFPQLDEKIMGLQKGGYYIFAGVPKSGKSSLVENICINLATAGHPGAVFSVEMSKEQWVARALCSIAEVPLKVYVKNELDAEQRKAINAAVATIEELSQKGTLFIDESPDLMISDFEQRLARAVQEKKIEWFALDYLQLLNTHEDKHMKFYNATEAVTYASSVCRRVCRKYGVSGLVVSSLSKPTDRKKQGERPTYNDLRNSGQISFDAYAVIMIHRPEMFKPGDSALRGKAEAIVGLTRTGEAGTCHLEFRSRYTKFIDNGPLPDEYREED